MELVYPALAIVFGLVALVYGADRFVLGAATLARAFGLAPLLVGVLVVGLGTSAPEMLVSAVATADGSGGMAIGNALGSNISNIGLVLGTTALIAPIQVRARVARTELVILVGITLAVLGVLFDSEVGRIDALVLCAGAVLYVARMLRVGGASAPEPRSAPPDASPKNTVAEEEKSGSSEPSARPKSPSRPGAVAFLVLGLVLLLGGSRGVVWGASLIAGHFGLSDLVIGLTVVAIGTSLPELAASVTSALRGHHELAVGNVIGSNMFNLLAVLPIPGFGVVQTIESEVVTRDYTVMLGFTVLLFLMARFIPRQGRIGRVEGGVLLLGFVGYLTWVAIGASS